MIKPTAVPEQPTQSERSPQMQANRIQKFWYSIRIRYKILVPLILLMLLATLSSGLGYIAATNSTRNEILDGQLNADLQRLTAALNEAESEVAASAQVLTRASGLTSALIDGDDLELNRQALLVRERFRLDQVLVISVGGETLVNIAAQSSLSRLSPTERSLLLAIATETRTRVVQIGDAWLLVGAAPVFRPAGGVQTRLANIYTIINLGEAIERYRGELGLLTEAQISDRFAPSPPASGNGLRQQASQIVIGGESLIIDLSRSETEINAILSAGRVVVGGTSLATLILLGLLGLFLASTLTRPIEHLSEVARRVASGDFSARAGMLGNDEIGQLGKAFDSATATIDDLLTQRARSEGQIRAVLNSIADGVLAVNRKGEILIFNDTAAMILECQRQALLGNPIEALALADDPVKATALEQVVSQVRREIDGQTLTRTDEQIAIGPRIVRLQSAPIITDETGRRAGAVVVLQDMTAIVEADRTKTEFIATASHELRTPLASMKGYLDIFNMLGIQNLTDDQRTYLEVVRRQTDNMVQLVNDLLEMARIEQGTLRTSKRWVSPSQAIDEAVNTLHEFAQRRQVELTVEVVAGLPNLWVDPIHLRRVLTNLISNGIKYVYQGGGVEVRAFVEHQSSHERQVVVEIEDNGVGIRVEDQPKIFGRFFRSDNPLSVEVGGTGLGLAITRALVEHNGGQISFTSQEGKGTCFRIMLPAPVTEPVAVVNR